MKKLKGIQKKGNKFVFRVNTQIYSIDKVEAVFGKGRWVGKYLVYEQKGNEAGIYEKFNCLLE